MPVGVVPGSISQHPPQHSLLAILRHHVVKHAQNVGLLAVVVLLRRVGQQARTLFQHLL